MAEPDSAAAILPEARLCLFNPARADCECVEVELLDGGEGLSSGKEVFGASGLVPGKSVPLPSAAAAAAAAADVLVSDVLLGCGRVPARERVEGAALREGFVRVAPLRFLGIKN